ncbi:MAG: DUF4234 domain-containing protein [Candidatus Bathyarchaeota archaeon]|nr:MAG: DUF4234 domain-containing protein [Candidatus Bathyarchaeota archaeon]
MTGTFDNLKKYIQMREKTDRQMSNFWLVLYFLPVFVAIVAGGYFMVSLMAQFSSIDSVTSYDFFYDEVLSGVMLPWFFVSLSSFTSVVVGLVVPYFLVNRRKTHFNRQKLLSQNLIGAIDSVAQTTGVEVQDTLLVLQKNVKEANSDKTDKNPILWGFLSAFIPFLSLYVYYFLVSDFYKHEQLENSFWEQSRIALNQLGITFSVPQRAKPMDNRSFVLYLILTIVTTGLFGAYWFYVLLNDPNQHFEYHKRVETQLLSVVESAGI